MLLIVAIMLFATPAFADSGFDNFPNAFKTEPMAEKALRESRGSRGARGSHDHGSHCMPQPIRAMLDTVRSLFGSVGIISAHRPGAKIAGTNKASYHASCQAVDIVPPKNRRNEVIAYLKANWNGGLGTYSCGAHHVHLDTGPRVRFHKCH